MRILVSVRDAGEARIAAEAGVDFIDLKDPSAGALGGLGPQPIREILRELDAARHAAKVSATIGDLPAEALEAVLARVAEVAACGVDLVKVGVPGRGGPAALALVEQLARVRAKLVPVLIADHGLADDFVAAVMAHPFAAVMLDTQAKTSGSLLQLLGASAIGRFLGIAQAHGRPAGLAGALRLADMPALHRLAPDFAGFRSAVCDGDRAGALSPRRLRSLLAARLATVD